MPRREFLYDIRFWEARRIIRGYRKRGRLEQQLLRLTAYFSCFCMRENKDRKSPNDWLPFSWEEEEEEAEAEPPISEDEVREMQELMKAMNEQSGK